MTQQNYYKKRKLDAPYFHNVALHYLGRYAASVASMRQILWRRVEKAERAGQELDRAALGAMIEAEIQKLLDLGLLDDENYAKSQIESARRRGLSARKIRGKLYQKGVASDIIDDHLADGAAAEFLAALRYAKKKRLPPFVTIDDHETRQNMMARMARGGFSFDVIQKIFALDLEAAEDMIYGHQDPDL